MISYLTSSWNHRFLIWRLARREVEARFRGSLLGVFWALVLPLMMLGVFSLVFGSVFGTRWVRPGGAMTIGEYGYPMVLFSGLIIFGIISEPVTRAPGLVLENISYVKKVVFPLEILPLVALISAIITAAIAFVAFLAVFIFLYGLPPITILALPLILLPLVMTTIGIVYFFASLGVFLRDLAQVVAPLITAIMFLSPLLYPLESLPEPYRPWLYLNPLTTCLIQARDVIFWGKLPPLGEWAAYFLISFLVMTAGGYWFTRTKKAFADVV
ncbi:sugar ABC transporter permease [Mesorhizobium sp. Root157]|uniref:ABC transporter permease n=1 Tax=Mesorhizobium sp. Root157 TaxID=1736477 RepID=UPI0006F618CC|nr:ABC transporter permease [Mesorhizobium sp. Root157]KQZ81967.1 sugar ABC transporter permease [Mesorhizobium sp. Root157]